MGSGTVDRIVIGRTLLHMASTCSRRSSPNNTGRGHHRSEGRSAIVTVKMRVVGRSDAESNWLCWMNEQHASPITMASVTTQSTQTQTDRRPVLQCRQLVESLPQCGGTGKPSQGAPVKFGEYSMQHRNYCTPQFDLVPRCQVSRCPVPRFQSPPLKSGISYIVAHVMGSKSKIDISCYEIKLDFWPWPLLKNASRAPATMSHQH